MKGTKWDLEAYIVYDKKCGLNLTGLYYSQLISFCEHSNELPGGMGKYEILVQLSDCSILQKDYGS
jgi:hypothetical protein